MYPTSYSRSACFSDTRCLPLTWLNRTSFIHWSQPFPMSLQLTSDRPICFLLGDSACWNHINIACKPSTRFLKHHETHHLRRQRRPINIGLPKEKTSSTIAYRRLCQYRQLWRIWKDNVSTSHRLGMMYVRANFTELPPENRGHGKMQTNSNTLFYHHWLLEYPLKCAPNN